MNFLFEYLRSILYDKEIQTLDITKLDEPYQKLGRRLQVLERTVEEMLEYSKDLSVGNWKNTEKSEGSFKRGFYHELQLWCGGI